MPRVSVFNIDGWDLLPIKYYFDIERQIILLAIDCEKNWISEV